MTASGSSNRHVVGIVLDNLFLGNHGPTRLAPPLLRAKPSSTTPQTLAALQSLCLQPSARCEPDVLVLSPPSVTLETFKSQGPALKRRMDDISKGQLTMCSTASVAKWQAWQLSAHFGLCHKQHARDPRSIRVALEEAQRGIQKDLKNRAFSAAHDILTMVRMLDWIEGALERLVLDA